MLLLVGGDEVSDLLFSFRPDTAPMAVLLFRPQALQKAPVTDRFQTKGEFTHARGGDKLFDI